MVSKKKGKIGLLLLIFVLSITAACTNGGRNAGSDSTGTSSGSGSSSSGGSSGSSASGASGGSGSAAEAPMEIKWLSLYPPEQDGNLVQKYIEEHFNVKLINVRIDRSNQLEQINLMLASGEVPDLWVIEKGFDQYAEQGLLAELDMDTVRKHMPTHAANVDSVDPSMWERVVYKGKMLGVPRYWMEGASFYLPAYNMKWLQAVGYDHLPTTLDELVDVLRKFRNNDPDGNGKKDTYGITGTGKDFPLGAFNAIFSAYQKIPMQWSIEDGKFVYNFTTNEVREAFRLLNQLYEEGVIDPEFITDDDAKVQEKFANQRIGVTDLGFWYHYHKDFGNVGAKASAAGVEFEVGKGVESPYGPPRALGWGPYGGPLSFGKHLENDPEKLHKIMEIVDWTLSDESAYLMTTYGQEGVHYEMKDDGTVQRIGEWTDLTHLGAKIGAGWFYSPLNGSANVYKFDRTKEQLEFRAAKNEGTTQLRDQLTFTLSRKGEFPDLSNLENEYWVKFITGEADVDKDWDSWVGLWLRSGGQALTDEANQIYASMK